MRRMRRAGISLRARAARLEEALRGLVELKAMKGELLNLRSDPYYASQAAMLEVQYEQRKPLAWAKARTALRPHPPAEE
jgi:hypothetical protein